MTPRYRVIILPRAHRDLEAVYEWIALDAPETAVRWFNRAADAIEALHAYPRRCPQTPEADGFGREIRQLRIGAYRVLFEIDGETVRVLHVRHAAREPLTRDDDKLDGDD